MLNKFQIFRKPIDTSDATAKRKLINGGLLTLKSTHFDQATQPSLCALLLSF